MDTPKRDKEKGLTIGLVAIIIVIVILALIGFFLLEPRTETIQGQAEATQIRISGKLPGRIAEYWVEEGQHVHQGDTLVRITRRRSQTHASLGNGKCIQSHKRESR